MGKAGKGGMAGENLEIRNSGTSGSELWTQRSREIETEPRARSLRGVNGESRKLGKGRGGSGNQELRNKSAKALETKGGGLDPRDGESREGVFPAISSVAGLPAVASA
jgi:hypothetical protein